MATLPLKYNTPENKEGLDDYTPIAAGSYIAAVTKSTYKETKAKTGHYLQLIFKIIDGKNKGRMIFENLNLDNPNPIAVEIANKTLNSICQACNLVGVEDSTELHDIPVEITVKVTPATAMQPASNSITAFKAYSGEISQESPSTPDPVGTPNAAKKLPWE